MTDGNQLARVRPGFALPSAIIALVLLSALVAGALFISTEELRAGRVDVMDQRALAAAEWGLERAVLGWDADRNTRQVIGNEEIVDRSGQSPNDSVVVTAVRVQPDAVWLTASATAGGDAALTPARHRIGASLRLVRVNVPMDGALTASGTVVVDGGLIDGGDSPDSSGYCPSPRPIAGVIVVPGAQVECTGCGSSSDVGLYGTPPIDSLGDSSRARIPATTAASLAERASITLSGGTLTPQPAVVGGECNRADALNWGDPSGATPCRDRFPIVHVRGSATLAGGSRAQGILVDDEYALRSRSPGQRSTAAHVDDRKPISTWRRTARIAPVERVGSVALAAHDGWLWSERAARQRYRRPLGE